MPSIYDILTSESTAGQTIGKEREIASLATAYEKLSWTGHVEAAKYGPSMIVTNLVG